MTAYTLTATQMADILFQRPGRVTEGVLPQRTLWERARDSLWTWNDTDKANYSGLRGAWQKKRSELFLELEQMGAVVEEHPRSLRQAMLELKALGFSNGQVAALKIKLQQFNMNLLEYDLPLARQIKKDFPGYTHGHCDAAFIGAARYKMSHDWRKSVEDYAENTILSPAAEELAYESFVAELRNVSEKRPDLFKPQSPIAARFPAPQV